jgi:hypothetical protein
LIAALVHHEVENLRDGTRQSFDAKALRKRWKSERRAHAGDAHKEVEPISQFASTGD